MNRYVFTFKQDYEHADKFQVVEAATYEDAVFCMHEFHPDGWARGYTEEEWELINRYPSAFFPRTTALRPLYCEPLKEEYYD